MPYRLPIMDHPQRRLRLAAGALVLGLGLGSAVAADGSDGWPDQEVLAGIAACDKAATEDGLLSSLCRNRNEIVAMIRVCGSVEPPSARVDAAALSRWDQRNAAHLRWVGTRAAKWAAEPEASPDEVPLLWTPPADAERPFEAVDADFQESLAGLPADRRQRVCADSRQALDAGRFDEGPPPGT